MIQGSLITAHPRVDTIDPPDLTGALKLMRIVATGSLTVVYRCTYEKGVEVAVKAIAFPLSFSPIEKNELMDKVKRELRVWIELEHPNIVPFLGTVHGGEFGSDYPCIVSTWMANGTLNEFMNQRKSSLSLHDRMKLIEGSVSGLKYLHSLGIGHGNFHPGNIVIDDTCSARLTDIGFSLPPSPMQDQMSYLWMDSIRPGGPIWAAPEVLYPQLYPKVEYQATLQSDIYSLGSIIYFILSGQFPWRGRGEAESGLKKFQNPPRPAWPVNMPDNVWNFIERCWSPRDPGSRPSAEEVSSFCTGKLEGLLRPNPASEINVVLFGTIGSGKDSVVNLLTREPNVSEFSDADGDKGVLPGLSRISLNGRKFRLWNTTEFLLAHKGRASHLSPYEHAHTVFQYLPEGVNLILLCADKSTSSASLSHLYWLINNFFYGGRAPIAIVATHFGAHDTQWWERNVHDIARKSGILMQSIPYACITTDPVGRGRSEDALKQLLLTYGTAVPPIPLLPDFSSYATASSDLVTHCGLANSEAISLVDKFRKPPRPLNIVFFGEKDIGTVSIMDLISENPGAKCLGAPLRASMGMPHVHIWDAMEVKKVHNGSDAHTETSGDARRLVRNLSSEDGIDLLVFCKKFGNLTPEEQKTFRSFKNSICKGRSPVALVISDFESPYPAEKWWERNGKGLVKSMGGNIIGYACIPPLPGYGGTELDEVLVESRSSIEAMLQDAVYCGGLHRRLETKKGLRSYKFLLEMMAKVYMVIQNMVVGNFKSCPSAW